MLFVYDYLDIYLFFCCQEKPAIIALLEVIAAFRF